MSKGKRVDPCAGNILPKLKPRVLGTLLSLPVIAKSLYSKGSWVDSPKSTSSCLYADTTQESSNESPLIKDEKGRTQNKGKFKLRDFKPQPLGPVEAKASPTHEPSFLIPMKRSRDEPM